MDGFNINHANVLGGRNGEIIGENGDFVAIDLDSVILVEDVLFLGELGCHWALLSLIQKYKGGNCKAGICGKRA
jgi:hypothetical protein